MPTAMTPPRLRRKDASAYLLNQHGISRAPNTLAKLACTGGGPRFVRFGSVPLYEITDLDAWVREHISLPLRSTSEAA